MVAEIVAIISLILALTGIILDLGRPDRMLNLFIYFKLDSPLIWDVFVINIYLMLCLAMLFFSIKNKIHLVKIFAAISIPAFVPVHSITAWIFGLMKSQPGWHTSNKPTWVEYSLIQTVSQWALTFYCGFPLARE